MAYLIGNRPTNMADIPRKFSNPRFIDQEVKKICSQSTTARIICQENRLTEVLQHDRIIHNIKNSILILVTEYYPARICGIIAASGNFLNCNYMQIGSALFVMSTIDQ
ncbi:hypothetical protein AVEN_35254-1 [Araneus ventricosus]|uniref:Uncharacterized protein n=1 Tax=Araneus ventricosus TaxID=182803 RepID=A0A4Y2EEM5_ARAVE|nr:hypothetical protein AVEN_35254-1 [Araneus ventricosus]